MTDGPLHTGRGGLILFGNGRIKNFGDGIDHLFVGNCHENGGTQILIALDMGRNPDLVNHFCNLCFKVRAPVFGCLRDPSVA